MQSGNDMIPGEYNQQEPSSYPPYMRGYGNPSQPAYAQMHSYGGQPPYKMSEGQYKQQMDQKMKENMLDEGPKKPQDH